MSGLSVIHARSRRASDRSIRSSTLCSCESRAAAKSTGKAQTSFLYQKKAQALQEAKLEASSITFHQQVPPGYIDEILI